MSYPEIEKLQPREFFRWFCQVSRIPRESEKEDKIISFLLDYAKKRNIPCQKDEKGNVYMEVPATEGYENEPAILFQAHVDMVCRKDKGVEFDFDTQSLDLYIDGDVIRAKGTTLGADNAVGLATMLALGDGKAIAHPPLEFLFTVAEEVGMLGARAFDYSKIKARRMVNMDCGDSHVLAVSSSGRISAEVRKEFSLRGVSRSHTALAVSLSGGKSGHSAICANMGRACCANLMGDLLTGLAEFPVCLSSLEGSEAIMPSARATLVVPTDKESAVMNSLRKRFREIQTIYRRTDPDLKLEITPVQVTDPAIGEEESRATAALLAMLRTGQFRADGENPTTIVSSGAITYLQLKDGLLALDYGVRSTIDCEQALVFERCCLAAKLLGFELKEIRRYSGWAENPDSPLREKFLRLHKKLFGEEMELERVPGGIETSIVAAKLPDMDAIGIAPTSRGAHTTKEHLFIHEVVPYWALLKAVLAEKEG